MFGYAEETPQEDVRPFELERFVDPQARDLFVERLQRDGAITDYLLRLRRADRSAMWVEVTAHAEPAGDGIRVEALMRDVSERKRLEDQARDLYHQLLQAEKLAALGQTISGVAHELNNPLATILTWAERLAQRRWTIRHAVVLRRSSASRSARQKSSATCSPSHASVTRRARW